MNKFLSILYSLILLFSLQAAANNNMMYDKANQLYHNKNYDSAAKLYQQMLNDGYCSADLYYNTGNAYYRMNQIGMAIWCFEKALQIDHNKNFQDNLLLAKKRIKEPIDEVKDIFFIRWWQSLYQLCSSNTWGVIALVSFLLSFLFLFAKKLKPEFRFPSGINILLFLFSGFCLLMMTVRVYNETYHYEAIVIEPKTLFTFTSKREPIFINEGVKVKVVNTTSNSRQNGADYIEVELPDGRTGKIDRKAIKKL